MGVFMFLQGGGRLTDLMYVQEELKGSEYGHQHLFFLHLLVLVL